MDTANVRSSELHAIIKPIPARCELSLGPLIDFWTKGIGHEQPVKRELARMIEGELQKTPELFEPIEDPQSLARHRELLDLLMSVVFPPAFWDHEYGAALVPFQTRAFYATPSFERLLMGDGGILRVRVDADEAMVRAIRLRYVYAVILRRVYGIEVDVDVPIIFTVTDPDTGLDRHFKTQFDSRFLDVVTLGGPPPLGDESRVQARLADPDQLLDLLPLDRFVIRGFTVFKSVEVTENEVLSSLKRDLIDKESIVSTARFQTLQEKLRTLFRRPKLRFSLAAIDGDQVLMLNSGARLEHACIFADSFHRAVAEFRGTIYERAVNQAQPLIVDDLETYPNRTAVEDEILASGVRNIVVAPLRYQDELIGTLELDSPDPGDLSARDLPRLQEVLPLFSMAVNRSMEELEGRIQAFIKEKCTAIHPAVEWRFRKAALNTIEQGRAASQAGPAEMEPIVFDGVYPLYGLADIRGSSTHRALAIQSDLYAQLRLARDVLRAAHAARPLPALDQLAYRTEKHIAAIETSLSSGDEVAAINFLQREVERLLDHLQEFGADSRAAIDTYRATLHPRLGSLYRRRKEFEESVNAITDTISSYLDLEEQAAQAMIPHYFEKQKTDGVDYSIYVGGSLVEDGRFDPLYLKSLRLWQLMVSCGIATRVDRLRDRLPMALEVTHLILAQHAPLSIRFRFDEKKFDVDGAYNMRYEIVKKRIDKATVRGTSDRLTQPGKLAIVYTQPGEAHEYREHIDYLQHLGYIGSDVEELELEELQGVEGLRALRVAVELANPQLDGPVALRDLERSSPSIVHGRH